MFNQARHSIRFVKRDQRGQVLAMAAVSMVAVIAVGALAVDLGMAFAARAAAQRAADSAALAGASAFIDYTYTQPGVSGEAEERALKYALNNDVLARPIDPSQVTVWVIPDSQKVRVRIAATELPTWFARVLGVFSMDVAAIAAAEASEGGSSDKCVLPFAIPDLWEDFDDDENGDNIPNNGEWWEFGPGDRYESYNGDDICGGTGCNGTGLGSNLRDGNGIESDFGRRIWVKSGPKGQAGSGSGGDAGALDVMIGPGNFLLWRMPDPDKDCQASAGAAWARKNIETCNSCPIYVGEEYDIEYETEPGNVASIKKEMEDIFAADPDAEWNPATNSIDKSLWYDDPEQSPRVRIVALWSPADYDLQGHDNFKFNNLAKVFLEGGGGTNKDFAIYARFMGMVESGGGGSETGSLIRWLRLVE